MQLYLRRIANQNTNGYNKNYTINKTSIVIYKGEPKSKFSWRDPRLSLSDFFFQNSKTITFNNSIMVFAWLRYSTSWNISAFWYSYLEEWLCFFLLSRRWNGKLCLNTKRAHWQFGVHFWGCGLRVWVVAMGCLLCCTACFALRWLFMGCARLRKYGKSYTEERIGNLFPAIKANESRK